MLEKGALRRGKFVLSSGKESNYYLDGRVITLTPEGAFLTASIMLEMMKGLPVSAVGGPTLGADPIVGALAVLCHQQRVPLQTFIVRKAAKGHGMQKMVEGPELPSGSSVVIVDDVATTGKALIEAAQALQAAGIRVAKALVIVDRQEGAAANLAQLGIPLEAIFSIRDFGL